MSRNDPLDFEADLHGQGFQVQLSSTQIAFPRKLRFSRLPLMSPATSRQPANHRLAWCLGGVGYQLPGQ